MDSGFVAANGQKLYYEMHGDGDPVLLIMGLGGDVTTWGSLIPSLAEHFRVIAFDHRDAGRSSESIGDYSIADLADDTAALMDGLRLDRAHVAGGSMGGMVAQELALNHAAKIRKLILMSTISRATRHMVHFLHLMKWIRERDPDNEVLPIAGVLSGMYSADFLRDDAAVDKAIHTGHLQPQYPQSLAAKARQEAAASQHNASDRLGRIGSPTLVLVADQDMLTPVWASRQLAETIPGARLHILEGSGHGLLFEIPDKVSQAVIDFLSE